MGFPGSQKERCQRLLGAILPKLCHINADRTKKTAKNYFDRATINPHEPSSGRTDTTSDRTIMRRDIVIGRAGAPAA